jgi:hypothetical protein
VTDGLAVLGGWLLLGVLLTVLLVLVTRHRHDAP